jgi:hypothetical protein
MMRWRAAGIFCLTAAVAAGADAACVNKYVVRAEGPKRVLTFLTGMMTFPEAQELSKAITAHKKQPVSWLDDRGKEVAKQMGDMKVVQPMPVACGGKASGVVLNVEFLAVVNPTKIMKVKFDDGLVIDFEAQVSK